MKNMKNKYIGKNQKNEKNLIFFFLYISSIQIYSNSLSSISLIFEILEISFL